MTRSQLQPRAALVACALLAVLVTFNPGTAAAAPSAPVLFRCEPASYLGYTTTDAVIDLYAENAENLYGLDVELTFDPAIAQVVDTGPAPGVQIQPLYGWFVPGFVARNYACNAASSGLCASAGVIGFAATQLYPSRRSRRAIRPDRSPVSPWPPRPSASSP